MSVNRCINIFNEVFAREVPLKFKKKKSISYFSQLIVTNLATLLFSYVGKFKTDKY